MNSALEIIKQIEYKRMNCSSGVRERFEYLLKAFNVMREIAIKNHSQGHMDPGFCQFGASPDQCIESNFEERMSKEKSNV